MASGLGRRTGQEARSRCKRGDLLWQRCREPWFSPVELPPDQPDLPMEFDQAALMLDVAEEFDIVRTYSMCFPDDIVPLREKFGRLIGFNGSIHKKLEEPDDAAYRLLDRFLELGVEEYYSAGGVCLIEWADRVAAALPAEHLRIDIEPVNSERRRFILTAIGPAYQPIVQALAGSTGTG